VRHTSRNIIYHELIGLKARILSSPDPGLIGFEGTIVGETSNTLILEAGSRQKKILKRATTFLITLPDGSKVKVQGDRILGRPEERVKRMSRR